MPKQTKTNLNTVVAAQLSRVFRFVLVFVALTGVFLYTRVSAPVPVAAAVPSTLNFQARLLTGSGAIVPDGVYNAEFKLYNASASSGSSQGSCTGDANCLWTETRLTTDAANLKLNVKAGYLSVYLGDKTAFGAINWDQQLYLTMNIGGTGGSPTWDGEMTPRLRLTSVPYAFQAAKANQISTSSGGNTGSLQFGTLTTNPAITLPDASGTVALLQGAQTFTGAITFSAAGTALSVTNNVTVGGTLTVNGTNITNAGSTLNTASAIANLATGGAIGTAAATVDVKTSFTVNQTTAGQTITIPSPTTTTAGRVIYISNTGTASFTMLGSVINAGSTATLVWNGTAWTFAGADGSSVLNQNTLQQASANFWISGNGRADTSLLSPLYDVAAAGTLGLGTSTATAITIGKAGVTTTNAGALTVTQTGTFNGGLTVSTGNTLTNASSTLLTAIAITDKATGGNIGTAVTTVDVATTFTVNQTTAGQTLTVPNPTVTTAGRLIYISNVGTASFTMLGATISTGTTATLIWNGTAWTFAGADASSVLNQNTVNQTANFRISGTGQANTSFVAPLLQSLDSVGSGNGSNLTIQSGAAVSGNNNVGGNLILKTGDAVTGNTRGSGTITIDSGTSQGGAATGTITIGGVNASALTLGRAGLTTTNAGALTVTQLLTANLGATILGATSVNASGTATTTIGNAAGALNINGTTTVAAGFSQTGANTFSTGTGAVTLNGNTSVSGANTLTVGAGATSLGGTLGVTGTITGSSTIQGTQLISTVAAGTAPLSVVSSTMVTNLNSNYLGGLTESGLGENLRAQANISGGGTISWTGGNLSWTTRLIVISNSTSYTDINMPANGTVITGVGGAANVTVTASGIPLPGWQALYYVPATATYRVASYTGAAIGSSSGWILIAVYNADNGSLRLGTGLTLLSGQTSTNGVVNNAQFNTSATSPLFVSTVATGTAPLTVASTTKVTNLNADLLDGLDSTAFAPITGGSGYIQLQNTTPGTAQTGNFNISGTGIVGTLNSGAITTSANLQFSTSGLGAVSVYDPAKTQGIWSMGAAYGLPAGGGVAGNMGNLYGLGWSYEPDYGAVGNNPQSKAGLGFQELLMWNGVTQTAIGSGVWTNGTVTAANFSGPGTSLTGTAASLNIGGNAGTVTNGVYTNTANTLTGTNYFQSNKGATSTLGANNTYGLEAYSGDGGAAAMSFHRGGAFAVNFGLDPDNVLRIGGWSAAANRWQLDMSGNETLAGGLTATTGTFSGAINGQTISSAANFTGTLTAADYSTFAGLRLKGTDSSNTIWQSNANTNLAITANGGDIVMGQTSTTTQFVLKASGNLGVGVASPQAKLHVVGGTYLQGDLGMSGQSGIASQAGNFNVAPNSSFEVKTNAAGTDPDGWTSAAAPGNGTATVTRASDSQSDGTYAMKLANTGTTSYSLFTMNSYIPIKPSTSYMSAIDIRHDTVANNCSGSVYIRVYWYTSALAAASTQYSDSVGAGTTTTSWATYGGGTTLTSPANATFAKLEYYNFQNAGSCTRWYDNAVFRPVAFTGDASFTSTLNVVTGYKFNGGATAGTYLRGDGTNFVQSAILAGDLPAGSTNYLAKNTADTSSAAITAGNWLYTFTNTTTNNGGVLKVDGGNNPTGTALQVIGGARFGTTAIGFQRAVSIGSVGDSASISINNSGTSGREYALFSTDTASTTGVLGAAGSFTLFDQTAGASRLTVLNSGNIGIGTIAPLSRLSVSGNVAIGTYAASNAAPANGLIVSGSVGIGTNNPGATLEVNSTGTVAVFNITNAGAGYTTSATLRRASNTVGGGTGLQFDGLNSASAYTSYGYITNNIETNTAGAEAGGLTFWSKTAGTIVDRVYLNGAGNFGIGTGPANRLTVAGNSDISGFLRVGGNTGGSGAAGDIVARRSTNTGAYYFGDSSANYLYFDGTNYTFGTGGTNVNSLLFGGASTNGAILSTAAGTLNVRTGSTQLNIDNNAGSANLLSIANSGATAINSSGGAGVIGLTVTTSAQATPLKLKSTLSGGDGTIAIQMGANTNTENAIISLNSGESASKNLAVLGFGLGALTQFRVDATTSLFSGNVGVGGAANLGSFTNSSVLTARRSVALGDKGVLELGGLTNNINITLGTIGFFNSTAQVAGINGTSGQSNSGYGSLTFSTNNVGGFLERAKIDESGNVLLNENVTSGTTTLDLGSGGGTSAVCHTGGNTATDNVQLTDCTGAPAADYAERYPVAAGTEYGEIVTLGTRDIVTKDGDIIKQLVRSSSSYDTKVIGIVSNNYGDFTSAGNNLNDSDNPMPVALNGRVPVKIAANSEPIMPGDFLTTSSTPGRAMKATRAGQMIGKAIEAWAPNTGKDTVMIFVTTSYADPVDHSIQGSAGNGEYSSLNVSGQATTGQLTVTGTTITRDLTVTGIATIRSLTVLDAITTKDLTVQGIATIEKLTVKDVTVTGGLIVQGGISTAIAKKSADYTATLSDSIITADATDGEFKVSLPTASGIPGRQFTIKKTDSTTHKVIIETANTVAVGGKSVAQTIDGATTYTLGTPYKYVTIVSDGTNWIIVGNN